MTRYLTVEEVIALHDESILLHGGAPGLLDRGMVESAVALPQQGFSGTEAYPTLVEKAAVLGFALISNHGFRDGNKRIGFAAMDAFVRLNGYAIVAPVDDAERMILGIAAGTASREELAGWLRSRLISKARPAEERNP